MDREQNAIGFVHFSSQIPLECTSTTDLLPKFFETLIFLRETDISSSILGAPGAPNGLQTLVPAPPKSTLGCSFCLQNNSIPK